MEAREINQEPFDYLNKTDSYFRILLDMMPESMMSNQRKYLLGELYNFYMSTYSPEKIEEITKVSRLFGMKMEQMGFGDMPALTAFAQSVKLVYLDRILENASSRGQIFDQLLNHIRVTSGFYDECKNNVYTSVNGFGGR